MKLQWLSIILLVLLPGFVSGQVIEVTDNTTGTSIENVSIYNLEMNRSVQTDSKGLADLSAFSDDDILYFQHPSYHEQSISYQALAQAGFRISLKEKIIKIDEIIISASKWEQNPDLIPNTVLSINSRTIDFNNPPTAADMLEQTGQVFMQKSQLGGGSPMIRGFAANQLLMVLDGVRMNNAIYRSGNLHNVISIDVNAVEEAEVLFGPGSVMYGSDALGGVMDFHTKSPDFNGHEGPSFDGNVLLRYASAAKEKTAHADFSLAGNKLASFTSLSFTDFDDLVTGSWRTEKFPDYGKRTEYVQNLNGTDSIIPNKDVNLQRFSGYHQYNIIQKFKYRPGNAIVLDYGFYFTNSSNIPRYDRLILYDYDSLPENAEWYYGPQKWVMNRLTARLYRANRVYSEARFILSHQYVNESRVDRRYKDPLLKNRQEKVQVINFNADFDKTINDHHQLFYGIDVSYNKVISQAYKENISSREKAPTSTRYPDGGSDYGFLAAYVKYLWAVNGKHNINAGLRYTRTALSARLDDQGEISFEFDQFMNNNGAVNGSLGWVFKPHRNAKLDVIASSGFRSPNVDDMGKLFDSEPGYVVVPNKDLEPEYAYNLEMGLTYKISQNLEFHIVGFYTWLTNAMVRRDFTFNSQDSLVYDGLLRKVQALVNTGKANIYGFSIALRGDISTRLGIFSSLNYTNGRDLTHDVPLRHTPPLFGRTALYYRQRGFLSELEVKYSGRKKYEDLAPSEKNKSYLYTTEGALAWYAINLMASYEVKDIFIFNFGIENILDKHYRTYSSGISAPGRNFIIGIRVKL